MIDRAWQLGAQHPAHLVSNGDGAIAAGIELVYGGEAPHQLCAFHLLREYRRNIGASGFAAARRLLNAGSVAEGREWARRMGGALLVRESVVQGTASLGDGTGEASDDVAIGASQSGVAAAGAVGNGMDGAQPAGVAASAGPNQPNHLKRNATQAARYFQHVLVI